MIGIVQGRAKQVVHGGIDDDKVFAPGPFDVLHAGDEDAGVANNKTPRLDQDFQAERFEQRRQARRVKGRSQDAPGRGSFPPGFRTAGQGGIINDAQSPADAEKFQTKPVGQPPDHRQDFPHGLLEWPGGRQLRTDMHLDAAQAQIGQPGGAGINALHLFQRDPEFVFVSAGGDFGVCVRVHAGVDAHGHRRDFFQAGGDPADAGQFLRAFRIETIHVAAQCELDLALRFADARENAGLRGAAGGDDPAQFAFAHDVEAGAEIGQDAQDGQVRIRFDGEADPVVQGAQSAVEAPEMALQRLLRINVKGRAVLFGQRLHGSSFAEEFAVPVMKRMHDSTLGSTPRNNNNEPRLSSARRDGGLWLGYDPGAFHVVLVGRDFVGLIAAQQIGQSLLLGGWRTGIGRRGRGGRRRFQGCFFRFLFFPLRFGGLLRCRRSCDDWRGLSLAQGLQSFELILGR